MRLSRVASSEEKKEFLVVVESRKMEWWSVRLECAEIGDGGQLTTALRGHSQRLIDPRKAVVSYLLWPVTTLTVNSFDCWPETDELSGFIGELAQTLLTSVSALESLRGSLHIKPPYIVHNFSTGLTEGVAPGVNSVFRPMLPIFSCCSHHSF